MNAEQRAAAEAVVKLGVWEWRPGMRSSYPFANTHTGGTEWLPQFVVETEDSELVFSRPDMPEMWSHAPVSFALDEAAIPDLTDGPTLRAMLDRLNDLAEGDFFTHFRTDGSAHLEVGRRKGRGLDVVTTWFGGPCEGTALCAAFARVDREAGR